MIDRKHILTITKRIFEQKQGGYFGRRIIHASRDWMVGLSIAVVGFIGVSVYAGYVFINQNQALEREIVFDSGIVTYEGEGALEILEVYDRKRIFYETLIIKKALVSVVEENTEEDKSATTTEGGTEEE